MKQVVPVIVFAIVAGIVGFKIGDSHGFQEGYKVGYTYDCREEIKSLREQQLNLKKAVNFADQKANQVQEENSRLKAREYALERNPQAIADSIRLAPQVQKSYDSMQALVKSGKLRAVGHVDPYTGKVTNGPDNLLRMMEKK